MNQVYVIFVYVSKHSYHISLMIFDKIWKYLGFWLHIRLLHLSFFLGAKTLFAAKNQSRCGETNAQKI